MELTEQLRNSLVTGFIDKLHHSDEGFRPNLVVNDKAEGKTVLTTIKKELEDCNEFFFSVAFITTGGLVALKQNLRILEEKKISGKILTSQYLNFTDPQALRELSKHKNIELRISTKDALHSKGYIFRKNENFDLIIGSSNLTASALQTNKEWNLKITANQNSELINQAILEFNKEFNEAIPVDEKYLVEYQLIYKREKLFQAEINALKRKDKKEKIEPNKMQLEALSNLERFRLDGKNKALLISATGTGKTYLSAFDIVNFKPKKFLFIVHRRTIALKAKSTFETIIDSNIKTGVFSGSQKELEADYLFCTIQTLAKDENLALFARDYFDYIVIDETHRAEANTYKKIINHFSPKFLLGMTATPERTDAGDVFGLFDNNIAFEMRLHDALEYDMLCPFHYFGINDLTIDGEEIEDKTNFNKLVSKDRVDHILEQIEYFSCDDGEVRGLIFCSRNEIAHELSKEFNRRQKRKGVNYRTIALTGDSSETARQEAIDQLESDDLSIKLDYIFSVDIFNEGVDIPKVNQIIMLRPTESAIIFVQQLGRGLRKIDNKSYLTVLDFIGNYTNNYKIPIALFGDRSFNKDNLRRMIQNSDSILPGTSTINFERIALEKILQSINQANFNLFKDLKNEYKIMKMKLGRMPMMMDFILHDGRDPWSFIASKKSFLNFVLAVDDDLLNNFEAKHIELLELFSVEINNGKRIEESFLLNELIQRKTISVFDLKAKFKDTYGRDFSSEVLQSSFLNLNFDFVKKTKSIIITDSKEVKIGSDLEELLKNQTLKEFLFDSIEYSICTFAKNYSENLFVDGFIRYQKYSRKDVCRILNWQQDFTSTLFGYRTINNLTPCFVTYQKSEEISDNTKYNDHFIDKRHFAWQSRSNRKIESEEIQKVINSRRTLLFVKKEDNEGTDFYYIGEMKHNSYVQSYMEETNSPVVNFNFELDQAVEDSIFNYLVS